MPRKPHQLKTDHKPTRLRGPIAFPAPNQSPRVDREGGKWGAGTISGFAVITRGEALGHNYWIDQEFCRQVAAAMQANTAGTKSRFTHPDLSSDGLAKYLGRAFAPQLDAGDERVLADLNFSRAAHTSPEGDLAAYLMDRAEEDPASFGASIVFYHDSTAEGNFLLENGAEIDEYGYVNDSTFVSPDPANVNNFPHARLEMLDGVDMVDQPAANPGGLFHSPLIVEAEAAMGYALGLSENRPTATALNVDPDRLRQFVARYLKSHGLTVVAADPEASGGRQPVDSQPSRPLASQGGVPVHTQLTNAPIPDDKPTPAPDAPAVDPGGVAPGEPAGTTQPTAPAEPASVAPEATPAAAGPLAQAMQLAQQYVTEFGALGHEYLTSGLDLPTARVKYTAQLSSQVKELTEQLAAAQTELTELKRRRGALTAKEEPRPLNAGKRANEPGAKRDFASLFRVRPS